MEHCGLDGLQRGDGATVSYMIKTHGNVVIFLLTCLYTSELMLSGILRDFFVCT